MRERIEDVLAEADAREDFDAMIEQEHCDTMAALDEAEWLREQEDHESDQDGDDGYADSEAEAWHSQWD